MVRCRADSGYSPAGSPPRTELQVEQLTFAVMDVSGDAKVSSTEALNFVHALGVTDFDSAITQV